MMKQIILSVLLLAMAIGSPAQTLYSKLTRQVSDFESEARMKHAIFSICVVDGSGKPVFQRNSEIGMAVASSQKVLTSAASFELLGHDFRYHTKLGYTGNLRQGILTGNLILLGDGDPSLGSWRWSSTKPDQVLNLLTTAVKTIGITSVSGPVMTDSSGYSLQNIPDGWIWQDIGNYYGAGPGKYNWKENQYDLHLRSGAATGTTVEILNDQDSSGKRGVYLNELKSAGKGTGDNANIYLPYGSARSLVLGTIPVSENNFSISGSIPQPEKVLVNDLTSALNLAGIATGNVLPSVRPDADKATIIADFSSPSFDSLNYWFLRRSINLYGEAFIKTIAYRALGFASTQGGVETVRNFWAEKGIEKSAIKMLDGSGLSPQNRITTNALVKVMQYASTRPWFTSFYEALPLINGIKMKSGSIGGARSFTGYIRKADNITYTFAIVVNNYDGPSDEIVKKLYSVLDLLK